MAKRVAHTVAVFALMAVLTATTAAPGIALHHCRHFGTTSAPACECCEIQTAPTGCCEKPEPVETHCDRTPEVALASTANGLDAVVIGSTCCFISHEEPFSYNGSTAGDNGSTHQHTRLNQGAVLAASPVLLVAIAPVLRLSEFDASLHSSDPPSFILTHSYRC